MAAMGAVVDAVFGSYDLKNAKQWRDEDIQYREQEKQWREDAISREIAWRNADLERERRVVKLENEKRIIDARHKQLSAIAQLSALLAGFSMVSMVEINLPEGTNHVLLAFYGGVCCLEALYIYADLHAHVHATAAGRDALRDAHARGRSAAAHGHRAGARLAVLRVVAQALRARVAARVPAFPLRRVAVPRGGGGHRVGAVRPVSDHGHDHDRALRGRHPLLPAARRESVAVSRELPGPEQREPELPLEHRPGRRRSLTPLLPAAAVACDEPFPEKLHSRHTLPAPAPLIINMDSNNKFVVHKFGGTSVGSAECFAKVSDIVSALDAPRIAVVVSAIGGKPKVTDLLISLLSLAKQRKSQECEEILDMIREKHHKVIAETLPEDVGKPIEEAINADLKRLSELLRAISIMRSYNDSVVEFISGHGEVWSAKILTAVLTLRAAADGKKHKFHFVDAREFLIVEPDEDHGPVVQYDVTTKNIEKIIKSSQPDGQELTHLVITGFICSTTEGVMTTLKRDGSDFTASICGRVLKASSITIWTDVSGVLSSDPRRVPEAKILGEVSYEEAMELAYFGAKVIHPKTMTPAILEAIPIYIRNTFEPEHPGTKIFNRKRVELERKLSNGLPNAKNIVSGFSTVDDLALFNIEGSGMVGVHGTSSRLFSALDRVKVNVVLIAQASSEHSICFAVPMSRAMDVQEVVNETFFKEIHHGLIEKTEFIAPISIIAAVGDNMSATPGVCSRFFGALGRAGINVLAISQGSSERNISAVVRYEDSAAALRAVHSAFFLSDQTISIGIVGLEHVEDDKTGVGKALLEQYNQQREYLKQRFNVDIRIRAIATHSSSKMLLDHNGGLTSDALEEKADLFEPFDHDRFLDHVCADHLPHWLIVDVSNCPSHVKNLYPTWLNRNVHLITANINVAAASTSLHGLIRTKLREKELIFDSEACLAIGVPIFNTIQNFIQTGDDIRKVEFSGSLFLNSVLSAATSGSAEVDLPTLLKQHIDEFKSTLSVRDILDDVMGVRSAKKAVLLARELGFRTELQEVAIDSCWRYQDESSESDECVAKWDYERLLAHLVSKCEPLQQQISAAIANRAETPSLRLVAFIDAQSGDISVRVEALPVAHVFASLQPLQCAFAFYTARHAAHPVVVSGPIADSSITAGTLFGSILNLARNCGARESGAN